MQVKSDAGSPPAPMQKVEVSPKAGEKGIVGYLLLAVFHRKTPLIAL